MPTALGMYRTTQKQVPDLKPGDEYISLADQGFSMENMHATMRSSLPADPGASTSLNSMRKCEHAFARIGAPRTRPERLLQVRLRRQSV